jgi:VWFA-related protein
MRGSSLIPFLLWLPLAAQTPDLKTGTQIVIVDVSVSDAQGNPVRGIKQSEFSVSENGSSQTISHFDESSSSKQAAALPPMPRLEPNVYTNFSFASEDAPIDVLLIDTLNTPTGDQEKTRQELVAFVQGMRPDARVAVFALNTRLMLLQGVTSDRKLLLAAIENNKLVAPSPLANDSISEESFGDVLQRTPGVSGAAGRQVRSNEAMTATARNNDRTESTIAAFNQLARYLSGISGRKNLIWLSGSFPIDPLGAGANVQSLQETMNLLARSRVAVYPIDSRQMGLLPIADVSSTKYVYNRSAVLGDTSTYRGNLRNEHDTMQKVAQATGGKAFTDVNGIGQLAAKITDDGGNFYTLTYSPADKSSDGRYRKIHVQLASGSYTLSYRDGYYADAPSAKSKTAGAESSVDAMRLAMQRGAPEPTEILLKVIVVGDPALTDKLADGNKVIQKTKPPYRLVTIAYAVNPGDVTMPLQANGTRQVSLEFVALVYDGDGRLYTQQTNPVDVFAKPVGYQQFLHEGMRYQQQIAVPSKGDYFIRIGVHDRLGDKVGAIEVPSAQIGTRAQ